MAKFKMSILGLSLFVAACGNQDSFLEGERLSVAGDKLGEAQAAPTAVTAFTVPSAKANASWTHVNGGAQHFIAHPQLGAAPKRIWSIAIGSKDTKRNRTSAVPVSLDGRVFVQDSVGRVTAVSSGGALIWQRDLSPKLDDASEVGGGGLAVDSYAVYATTGSGRVIALDPSTGSTLWDQDLESYGGSAPTVYKDLVYVAARDGSAWAIERDNGRIRWQLAGPGVTSGLIGGPGPAITDKWALFPFGGGEVLSTYRQGGLRNWTASISGGSSGLAVNTVRDISADPVIAGNTVYVGTSAGPIAALGLSSGERLWTLNEGAFDGLWVAGNSVFFVDGSNKLTRVDADSGEILWTQPLPRFTKDKEKRRKGVVAHYGPIVAGGRVIVASSDGFVRQFDPTSGEGAGAIALPGGAAAAPIVVNNTLYVQSRDGVLNAYR